MNGHKDELPEWARERLAEEQRMGTMRTTADARDFAEVVLATGVIVAYWLLAIGFVGCCVWGLVWLVRS